MKFLLDENLSPRLVKILDVAFAESAHVRDLGMQSAADSVVWAYAAAQGYTIVTKDADFHHRSLLYGHPPKVIWIRLGNCATNSIAAELLNSLQQIRAFDDSAELSFFTIP